MKVIKVVGAQIPVSRDIQKNYEAICRAIEFAILNRADILLTPEGSLSGYTNEFDFDITQRLLKQICERAKKNDLGLALGTCFIEPKDNQSYNQIRFYSPKGRFLGFHSKILRCASLDKPPRGEINRYSTTPLRVFNFNGIKIGGLICNDLWANPECTPFDDPHLSQKLSDMGAKIIFHSVNGGRSKSKRAKVNWNYHESNLLMRAMAGKVWIVTVDNCYPLDTKCSSPSGVLASNGEWAIKTPAFGEQFFIYKIEI